VAIGVLGILMSAVYGSYRAVADSAMELRPRTLLDRRGTFFVQRFSRQVRCCYAAHEEPDHGDPNGARLRKYPALFQGRPESSDEPLLEFVTAAGAGKHDAPLTYLTAVAYKLDDSRRALLARECIYGPLDEGHGKDWYAVLEQLSEFHVEYYDGLNWQETWDADDSGGPPRAVLIRFTLESESRYSRSFTTVVPVLCRKAVEREPMDRKASQLNR